MGYLILHAPCITLTSHMTALHCFSFHLHSLLTYASHVLLSLFFGIFSRRVGQRIKHCVAFGHHVYDGIRSHYVFTGYPFLFTFAFFLLLCRISL